MFSRIFQSGSETHLVRQGSIGLYLKINIFIKADVLNKTFVFFPTTKLFYQRIFSSPISRLDHLVTEEISARFLGVFLLLFLCSLKSPNFLSALFQRVGISCMWNRRCCRNKIEKLQWFKRCLKIHIPWGEQSFKKDD